MAMLRPADVVLHVAEPEGSARNVLHGAIAAISVEGERARVRLDTAPPIVAEVTPGSVERLGLHEGGRSGPRSRRWRSGCSFPDRERTAPSPRPHTGTLYR